MLLHICVAIYQAIILFAVGVLCLPLSDSGPHIANGWGAPVRLRHLYAANLGLHLQINGDGEVDGSVLQSSYSLMEIRPVAAGYVAIKGVKTSRYLCTEKSGILYGSHSYIKTDCSFVEHILPNGYNIYVSDKYKVAVSLSSRKQRLKSKERGLHASYLFLPMVSTFSQVPTDNLPEDLGPPTLPGQGPRFIPEMDNMDPFGKVSRIIMQSPSFDRR